MGHAGFCPTTLKTLMCQSTEKDAILLDYVEA